MKDLEDLMPNKSLIPPPSTEEAGQWAKLIELVLTYFFHCVSHTGADIVWNTSKLLKSSNLSEYQSSFYRVSVSVTNLPFLLQRNQLTRLVSHQNWQANQGLQPPGKGYMFRGMCLWLRQILEHQWLALQVPGHPVLSQVMAVDLHQVKAWEEGEEDHHHEDSAWIMYIGTQSY